MVKEFGVQLDVGPSAQDRIDQCHTELADVRFGALCQLLLQALEPSNHTNPIILPDLLKDAAGHCSDGRDFLKFIVSHGVPRGLGEALDEAVYRISDESIPYKALTSAIEVSVFGQRAAVNRISNSF